MTVQELAQVWYEKIIKPEIDRLRAIRFFKEILIGFLILLIAGAGFFGYRFYSIRKEKAAQKVLFECIEEYNKASGEKDELWGDVEMFCKLGYKQYPHSSAAPYFLGFQAEALLKQDKKDEAFEVMQQMKKELSHSPVSALYETKIALLKMDMEDPQAQEQGIKELQACADDIKNLNRDMAMFYLASYYWTENETEKAQELWQKLASINQEISEEQGKSPWAELAQQRLEMIGA